MKKNFLALENGEIYYGVSCAAPVDAVGEAVFNTGMTGYLEIATDPSYAGQFVTLTCPEIGNYGCCTEDMESDLPHFSGFLISRLNEPSNFRSEFSLRDFLIRHGKPCLAGVETRKLTIRLRESGTMKSYLHCSDVEMSEQEAVRMAREWAGLEGQDYAARVTTKSPYVWNETGQFKVAALDFGIKRNILRMMAENDMQVTVFPASTPAGELLAFAPDGVFLSNGPADPGAVTYAIECVRQLLGKVPVMGICLGHQLLGLASGAKCGKLKFGHHGCNHPVRDLSDGSVGITSQNHNFALDGSSLPDELELTHINLNDHTVEGIRHKNKPAFSVQFHPEAAPGPHDSAKIFGQFAGLMKEAGK